MLKQYTGLTPSDKLQILNQAVNFSDSESSDNAAALVSNEADGIADLVGILKPEVLSNETALEEISEATDTDEDLIKDLAETKISVEDEGDAKGMSPEEKEEFFSNVAAQVIGDFVQDAFNRKGLLAFFSEPLLYQGFSDAAEDTVEAVKLIKYVSDDALANKDASEIATIVSEATDGDQEAIKDVVEAVQQAVNFANQESARVFSDTVAAIAAESGALANNNVQSVLEILDQAANMEQQRIAAGENISKRIPQAQTPNESTPTETDPIKIGELPSNIGQILVDQANGGINQGAVAAPAVNTGNGNPAVMFSGKNQNPGAISYIGEAQTQGYPQPTNFSNGGFNPYVGSNPLVDSMKEFAALTADD